MFEVESCIHGFHVYGAVWKPRIGETLSCSREGGNREDPFAVAVQKSSATVGHVPRRISCVCSLFLRRGGTIVCTVTASKRRSVDLPQGDLEVPCLLTFDGEKELLEKVRKRLEEIESKAHRVGEACSDDVEKDEKRQTKPCSSAITKAEIMGDEKGTGRSSSGIKTINYCSESSQKGQDKLTVYEEEPKDAETKAIVKVEKMNEAPFTNDVTVWLQFQDIVLVMNDKELLESGKCLTDQHMNFAQRLLRKQFPKMNGLHSTLLQHQTHSQETVNALQIFHIKRNHWIVASTKPKGKLVRVYDSVFSSVDQETARIIQTNFRCAMHSIRLVKCQKQVGAED